MNEKTATAIARALNMRRIRAKLVRVGIMFNVHVSDADLPRAKDTMREVYGITLFATEAPEGFLLS